MKEFITLIKRRLFYIAVFNLCVFFSNTLNAAYDSLTNKGTHVEAIFKKFITSGDSIYATKGGYSSFAAALAYFDSALYFSRKLKDTSLLAEATFAKGRVYDAWNKDKDKTIHYFSEALILMERHHKNSQRTLYLKSILAHAYEKNEDSLNALKTLKEIYQYYLTQPDSTRKKAHFIPEMAVTATSIKNYDLAEKILHDIYKREWIQNDSNTYNYLDHYYLVKSRIAINKYRSHDVPYLDSFAQTLSQLKTVIDSMEYASELSQLFAKKGDFQKAYMYENIERSTSERVNSSSGIESLQNQLLQSELKNEQAKAIFIQQNKKNQQLITLLLGIIVLLSFGLMFWLYLKNNQYRKQTITLNKLNTDLDKKIVEIELVNKDMQHRIKNNLQTVFSLLQMQERKTDNPKTLEGLQQARLRIESIALLHKQLIKSDRSEYIDFNKFSTDIINSALDCFANEKQVVVHHQIADVMLPSNTNFSLALILNEWVTNSLKYAQTKGNKLYLTINLFKQNNQLLIEYFDSGIQENKTSNEAPKGLGFEIVELLCTQMKGHLTADANNKYHYHLTIPYER